MSASIARFLKDFGEPEAPAKPSLDQFDMGSAFADFPEVPVAQIEVAPTIDVEAITEAAIEQGREAATADLTTKFEAEKSELVQKHAEELAKLREEILGSMSELLSARLSESMDQMAALFTDVCTKALVPVLTNELSMKAAQELADLVRAAMLDGEASKLHIKGPQFMFDALKTKIELKDEQYQFTPSDDVDLTVEIDQSVIVTRMSAWASSLQKVMQ